MAYAKSERPPFEKPRLAIASCVPPGNPARGQAGNAAFWQVWQSHHVHTHKDCLGGSFFPGSADRFVQVAPQRRGVCTCVCTHVCAQLCAVSLRQCSSSPFSAGGTCQDPQQVPETMDSAKPYISCFSLCIHIQAMGFNRQIIHSKRSITIVVIHRVGQKEVFC